MEPLKPEVKEELLRDNPLASPADVEEYERLLAERFTVDPDRHPSAQPAAAADREARLAELYRRIYRPDRPNP